MMFRSFPPDFIALRFTKNLSPDKINLSTLKGEGQLSNLELDEEVLQNMLDLPTWLAVTRVYCNKAAIRIQWTKLKTSPICLFLDKVEVEMRTCEEPRPPNGPSPIAITAGQSEYGFAEKVVEGMSVRINSITIKVQARAFHASFELWQLQGNSLNPKWQRSDLRYTRVTDPKRGEVLTFKEINWQSLRIEADAIESDDQDLGSTPLRLITNQGRIRIALKRRVKDCNVLASKLFFILDDLLWVLTDSQLKAIIHYAKSLSEAMEKSAQQRKSRTAESLQTAPPSPGLHTIWTDPPPAHTGTPSSTSQYFDHYDVKESSYHTFVSRLDLHICNDSSSPPPPGLQGAMQLTFRKLGFDYYPVHRPADGCRHWERHSGAMEIQAQWAAKLLQEYQRRTVREQAGRRNSARAPAGSSLKRLRSSCMVIRMDDVDIRQVSTRSRQNKKTQALLSCNRKVLRLPDNVPAVHLQFTEYYFPDNPYISVPTSNLYAQVNGLQFTVDPPSVLWISLFSRGLLQTLDQVKAFYHLQDSNKADEHIDIRMDAAQLKVSLIIPLDSSILDHPERPQSLSGTVPQMVLSNTRYCPHGSRADLNSTFHRFASSSFFRPTPPCPYPRDQSAFHAVPAAFLQHCQETECQPLDIKQLRSQDVWSLSLSRVTLGFDGARQLPKSRTQPFVESFAMSLWMCQPSAFKNGSSSTPKQEDTLFASVHLMVHVITPVKMWLNHYQYVALLRMKDSMARLVAELSRNLQCVKKVDSQKIKASSVCFALLVDSSEVGLLLPAACSEPEEEVPHSPETETPSMTDSDISPTHQSADMVVEENGLNATFDQDEQEGVVEEAYEAVEGLECLTAQEDTPVLSPPLSPGHSPALSREPSTFSLEGELSSAINVTKDVTKDAISASLDLTKGAFSITKDAFSMLSRGSGMSKLFTSQAKEHVQRSEESSPSLAASLRHQSMKQSPSQHSFDSAILDGSLPDETLSLDSEVSDNFFVLMDSESGMESMRPTNTPAGSRGSPAPGTEGGSSAELSSSLSQSIEDLSQDLVSYIVITSPLRDLIVHKSTTPSRPVPKHRSRSSPVLCMRTEMGPSAARHSALAESMGFMDMTVQDCKAELLSSTVANIGPFLEDEFSAESPPMRLHMRNISITIKDDNPKIYPTAPQPVPASFIVDQLLLERGEDGIMRLKGEQIRLFLKLETGFEQTLESQLCDARVALEQALGDRERLLLEIQKYDPTFTL
uniref:Bridge-like lipid transfer protein family member 3A n=1 Tax=Takifugu rubripes TaxID=31033 RepID=H2TS65_TAKRU